MSETETFDSMNQIDSTEPQQHDDQQQIHDQTLNQQPQQEEQQQPRLQGHIRGFYADVENRNPFAINFDTTSTEEQKRRRERLQRFGGDIATERLQQLDLLQEQEQRAKNRLERFMTQNESSPDESGSQHPEIMPFEDLERIPDAQIQYEMRGFDPTAPRRWDALHLFGTRLLMQQVRTEDLLQRYREDGLLRVEWQSDYRCNLVFTDYLAARRILDNETYVRDLDVARAKKHFPIRDENKSDEENEKAFDLDVLPFMVWRQSIYSEDSSRNVRGSLVMRLATIHDIKEPVEVRRHSQFYLDNQAYFNQIVRNRRSKAIQQARENGIDTTTGTNESSSTAMGMSDTIVELDPNEVLTHNVQIGPKVITTTIGTTKSTASSTISKPITNIANPTQIRGRGFAKGRAGLFDPDRPIVDKTTMNDDDNGGANRTRDRTSFIPQPRVDEDTPLVVTLETINKNIQIKKELDATRVERQQELIIKKQNNPMARNPIDYASRTDVNLPQHNEPRIYQPSGNTLIAPMVNNDLTGTAKMFQTVAEEEALLAQQKAFEAEQQRLLLEQQEQEKLVLQQQELERQRLEQEQREQNQNELQQAVDGVTNNNNQQEFDDYA